MLYVSGLDCVGKVIGNVAGLVEGNAVRDVQLRELLWVLQLS